MMGGKCYLCEHPKKRYLCAHCFNQATTSPRQDVVTLSKERDFHRERLGDALLQKEEGQRQALQLLQLTDGLRESRQKVAELEQRLQAIRRRAAEVRQQNLEWQTRLRDAGVQLGKLVQQANKERGGQMEALGQNYLRSLDTLSREHCNRVVRRLLDILPVKLMAPGSTSQGGSQRGVAAGQGTPEEERALVTICGLLLPDSRDDIGELVQLLPQLGSALGYTVLLLDVLSRFLQLPLLHRASFQGSTTRIWQPESFWDMRAAPPRDALPLFARKHPDGGLHDFGALYSAVAGIAGAGPGPEAEAQQAQNARRSLQRALYLLQRSAGAVVYARLGPDAPLKVPPDWSPLAWLGGLCKMLAAEPRHQLSASRVMAVSAGHHQHSGAQGHSAHARLAAGSGLAASAVFGRLSPHQDALGESTMWPDEEEGEEEWDIIPRPSYGRMIPPPPSQPDDVEHWTQAMYPGAAHLLQQAQQLGLQQQGGVGSTGSSPVKRFKFYFAYLGGGTG